ACLPQGVVELSQNIRSRDIDASDRLGRDHQPAHRRWRLFCCLHDPFLKQLGIGEEQWRVPAKEDKTRNETRIGVASDVVIAFDAISPSQHRRVRPPAIPEEFNDGDYDSERDARDCAQNCDARKTKHRKPELPSLYPKDADEIVDFDEPKG